MKKTKLIIEILKLLSEKGEEFLTTTEIFELLRRRGILSKKTPKEEKQERKRLQRALNDLFEEGYVERRFGEHKGKKPEEWRLNLRAFPYLVSYTHEEVMSLFVLTAFVPKWYREFEVLKPALKAIGKFGKVLDAEKKEIARESFLYLPTPTERLSAIEGNTLKLLFQAIVERKGILVTYKNLQKEIFPLRIFTYNGNLYLSALDKKGRNYRTYLLHRLKVHQITKTELPLFYRKRYKDLFFTFDREPFILKILLPADYYKDVFPEYEILLYPTQFHYRVNKDVTEVLLVAYQNYRFASWIILDEIMAISPPNENDLSIAKKKNLRKNYPDLSFSLRENKRRFNLFKKFLQEFLEKRKNLLKS